MPKTPNIVLPADIASQLDLFTDEELGKVIRAALAYASGGETISTTDRAVSMLFHRLIGSIDEAKEKSETYRRNAQKRWHVDDAIECNETQIDANNAIASIAMQNMQPMQLHNEEKKEETPPAPPKEERKENYIKERKIENKERKEGQRSIFRPPNLEQVEAYCQERGGIVDAQAFIDHYTSNGWMVGRARMKDWKAAVRNWERKENQHYSPNNHVKNHTHTSDRQLEELQHRIDTIYRPLLEEYASGGSH